MSGCENSLVDTYQKQLYGVGTAAVVFATFQLVALISSIIMFIAVWWDRRKTGQERVF